MYLYLTAMEFPIYTLQFNEIEIIFRTKRLMRFSDAAGIKADQEGNLQQLLCSLKDI